MRYLTLAIVLVLLNKPVYADPFLSQITLGTFKQQLPLVRNYMQESSYDRMVRTAGKVRYKAFIEYQGVFNKYLEASIKTRAGKVYEEMFATAMNNAVKGKANSSIFVPTAAIKSPQNPIEVLKLNSNGEITGKCQLKLSGNEARKALNNPKYLGQTIVVPNDQIDRLNYQLLKRKTNAATRGIPLPNEWVTLEDALNSGRLAGFSNTNKVQFETVKFLKNQWGNFPLQDGRNNDKAVVQTVFYAEKSEVKWMSESVNKLTKLRALGKCIVVTDYAFIGLAFAGDISNYWDNELDGGIFAGKTSLKAAQLYLGYIALADPEPFSKTASIALLFALTAADFGLDAVNSALIEPRKAYIDRLLLEMEPQLRGMLARKELFSIYEDKKFPLP